ncbi:MAG: hypothetical protein PUH02_07055, partial [bacterium]|nr:hypothetical protein [bacterium]
MKQNLSACAELVNDITVNRGVLDEEGNPDDGQFIEWITIGTKENSYNGIFDGKGCTIRGLYYSNKDTEYLGLFGYTGEEGIVQNVTIEDTYFFGMRAGSMCGRNHGSIINCYNKGTIDSVISSGGISGFAQGLIEGCSNYGSVYGGGNTGSVSFRIGGITGGIGSSGIVKDCYNAGSVTADAATTTGIMGGICGSNISLIQNCYNTGSITCGKHGEIGGIAAYTGSLSSQYPEYVNTIVNCYNSGKVTNDYGSNSYYGIVGNAEYGKVVNCYYLKDVVKSDDYATGKSSLQFKNGEVAFLLSQGYTVETTDETDGSVSTVTYDGSAWGQNIDNDSERQYYPALNGDTAKVYETSAESGCQGYSNTKDKVREHYFGENCTDEICD